MRASRGRSSATARAFHALVVLGPQAGPAVEAQSFGILDRPRFDPGFRPDWDFAG